MNIFNFILFTSNGSGRTGTFIVLDVILETLKQKQDINIKALVSNMRLQRKMFVENWV